MKAILSLALLFLAFACTTTRPHHAATFTDTWATNPASTGDVVRAWPGSDWHATRQEDWQVRGAVVECVNSKTGTAGRTLALLTQTIEGPISAPISLSLTTSALGAGSSGVWRSGAHVGLLFGVGGPEVDYKRSALVQQAPAEDGGWLLSINHQGLLRISSFHDPLERAGYWTLPGGVDFDALSVFAESEGAVQLDAGPLQLALHYTPNLATAHLGTGRLHLTAGPIGSTLPSSSILVEEFPEANLVGSLSLFSGLGAEGSSAGFGFSDFELTGGTEHPERALGPILAATYLVDRSQSETGSSTLRLTAHLAALGDSDPTAARLWLEDDNSSGRWNLAALGKRTDSGSDLVRFEVDGYEDHPSGRHRAYRVELAASPESSGASTLFSGPNSAAFYTGHIRKEPEPDEDWALASLSCLKNQVGPILWNSGGLWFPHEQLISRVESMDPDFLYFSGDQIYEGDLTGPDLSSLDSSIADYQTKYRRFLWAFSELLRDRPSVLIPDDHDVFHGNLWGAGGVHAEAHDGLTAQDAGGYRMPAAFVNVVHESLTSNLPPTKVSPTIGTGITTYTTDFTWGGVDFAVLADRMWKDSPSVMIPDSLFRNGWMQAEGADPHATDHPDARLLGDEQEAFLAQWAHDLEPLAWTKVALSQSPFACLHSLPKDTTSDASVGRQQPPAPGEYPLNDAPVVDGDSNGWPQSARNRAVALLAEAGALHLCGDQHLGTASWYGRNTWRDGTVAFTSPAMGNTWPRRWMPEEAGANRPTDTSGAPVTPRYTGDYLDGFGNHVTMLAVANPEENGREPVLQMNRAPGFGIVRFQPAQGRIALEAWPTWDSEDMYPGWPLFVNAEGRPTESPWE